MIRVLRFTILGALVLALGLGPIGCGGENTTSKGPSPAERTKKEEAYKKVAEEKKKGAAGASDGKADEKNKEDKPKSDDK